MPITGQPGLPAVAPIEERNQRFVRRCNAGCDHAAPAAALYEIHITFPARSSRKPIRGVAPERDPESWLAIAICDPLDPPQAAVRRRGEGSATMTRRTRSTPWWTSWCSPSQSAFSRWRSATPTRASGC